MNLTEQELKTVEELAELHFSIEQISIFLGKDYISLKLLHTKKDNEFYFSVQRGELKTEVALRKTILTDAKNGSSPAQAQFLNIIRQNKMNNLK